MRLERACLLAALGSLLLLASPALAYVGPSAGLTALGSALALFAAVLLAIVGFVWYPVRRLLRARRRKLEASATPTQGQE